ncbi:hypothetical protein Pint_30417 [Pistacia integerrima]|uniref:Uncharacterized protein n=1 Tax=Pistacia integerrima TaxID=434235 RepID=A0ACC0X0K3_9ROSI|nr:hypothetical protein Pint_30417 [Pistacia integerrima]
MELLGTFLDILKCIGPPLCTYIEYHRKLQENFSNLKRELNDLNSRKKDVEEMLKAEYAMGKLPKEEVSNWLRNIETITGEVENIEKEVHEKKIFSRVRLSKLVKEKIQKVKEYEQKRSSFQSLVIDTPPARGLTLPTTALVGANTQKNMEEIWAHLMGNEVTKIGVCGIGGVGKTTIIKQINNRLLQEKGKFDHVIWVTVSQPFDLAKLQDQIASMFDPNFKGPEDQIIRAAMLLRMFAGKRFVLILDDIWESFSLKEVGIPEPTKEGLVDERARMQAMYDEGYSILNRLVNNCLLESADDGRCVKMHDLIREMALDITSKSPLFMVKAGEKLQELRREQEWKQNLGKASLMRNEISEIPPNMSPDCQALSTLLLQENVYLENIPEPFFVRMQGLKILNLSYTSIEELPDSTSHLTNLTALLLQYCTELKHVPCLAKLVCLRSLDLEGTIITEVPEGMEMLQKLRYLNLFSVFLERLPAEMLSKLSCVQKLRVYWGSKTSEETVEEASNLSELDTLEVCFRKIEDFKMYVKSFGSGGPRPRKCSLMVGLPLRRGQRIQGNLFRSYFSFWPPGEVDVDRNVFFNGNFVAPSKDLQCLNKLLSAKLLRVSPNLEVIEVVSCREIAEIITLDGGDEKSEEDGRSNTTLTLPKLKILRLCNLPELKRICSSNGVMVCDSLEQIEVWRCPKLKRLPLSLPLPAIKEIKVEEDWWNSLEWDNPNAKNALQPYIKY